MYIAHACCFFLASRLTTARLDLLDEWEAPAISQVSKEIKKLNDTIRQQETANGQLINELRMELKQQKETVHVKIQKLQSLIEQKETAHTEYR